MTASPRRELYGGVGLPRTTTVLKTTPRAQFGTAAVKTPSKRAPLRAQPPAGSTTAAAKTRTAAASPGATTAAAAAAAAGAGATSGARTHGLEYGAGAPESAVEEVVDKKGGQTYTKGRLLGKGGFAKCYKFRHVTSKHVCAGKCVEKASLKKERARRKLLSEIKIHRSLSHTNVVRFEHFFEDKHFVYILLEYCNNQTLMELVKRKRRLSESHTRTIMLQLLDGVEYLHSVNVIHRDLKLGNIFLTDGLQVRIGDFGLAARLEHKEEKKKTMCGTPNYLAPEILDGSLGHSFEVDIWSLGVILYTLLVGKPPFETKNVKQTYKRIQANLYVFPKEIPLSAEAIDLVRIILNKDPKMRPSLKAIRAHPFFTGLVPGRDALARGALASPSAAEDKENAASTGNFSARPRASPKVKVRQPMPQAHQQPLHHHPQRPRYPESGDVRRLSQSPKVPASSKSHKTHLAKPAPSPRSPRAADEHHISRSPRTAVTRSPTTPMTPTLSAPLVVQKWVDYTSKYGLGYLLQGGLVGVYFNDATKLIVAPNRYEFQYYERGAQEFSRHTLSRYPKDLHKKVTLVKHFRNYLEKDETEGSEAAAAGGTTMAAAEAMAASAGGRSPVLAEHFEDSEAPLPFVKKWVRTRHAIFFRLSNRTVQVAFFDDTQILLSGLAKRLTYFDKSRRAHTLPVEEAKRDPEISKRLRYTKDVLHKLIAGSSPSPTR